MNELRLRPATRADLPRIHHVRHGTAENHLRNPALVADAEAAWYMDEAICDGGARKLARGRVTDPAVGKQASVGHAVHVVCLAVHLA